MANFSELVREAFIEPLRSVLIVDDEYPTWEEILNAKMDAASQNTRLEEHSNAKPWHSSPKGPFDVIKMLRGRNPGFIIDIHDALAPPASADAGSQNETADELASHLHQSDLLVLDYNLEGISSGVGGAKAREILSRVLDNKHFNLVIVHTGEHDLDGVMYDCLISLTKAAHPDFSRSIMDGIADISEHIDELEVTGEFERARLEDVFGTAKYMEARRHDILCSRFTLEYMRGEGVLSGLSGLANSLGFTKKRKKDFLYWAIFDYEKKRASDFSSKGNGEITWKIDGELRWLRSSKGFVSFVKKNCPDLIGSLQSCLENWKPTPSRLLSAKYRHVVNTSGVEAEDGILGKKYVFAQFYKNITTPPRAEVDEAYALMHRTSQLKDHVARQTESLSFHVEDEVVAFGNKVIEADVKKSEGFIHHYGVDFSSDAEARTAVDQYNSYVSTLPRREGRDQLASGHVLKIGGEWWVCATPACDLQPGQAHIAFKGSSMKLRPFTALKLERVDSDSMEGAHINSGSYCFVEYNGAVMVLGLRSIQDETKPSTQKVTWRTFIAEDGGTIQNSMLNLLFLKLEDDIVGTEKAQAEVVAKLRYEYAINYIQRVAASVSRVGLDYVV